MLRYYKLEWHSTITKEKNKNRMHSQPTACDSVKINTDLHQITTGLWAELKIQMSATLPVRQIPCPGKICANEVPNKITVTSVVCQFNLPPRKLNPQAVQSCTVSKRRKQNYKTSTQAGRMTAKDITMLLQDWWETNFSMLLRWKLLYFLISWMDF